QAESRSVAEVWSALGGELKPSLDLTVTVPFPPHEYDADPPVTEGAVVRVRATDGGQRPGSEERAHRPHQVAAQRRAREAAHRARMAGAAARAATRSAVREAAGTPRAGGAAGPEPTGRPAR